MLYLGTVCHKTTMESCHNIFTPNDLILHKFWQDLRMIRADFLYIYLDVLSQHLQVIMGNDCLTVAIPRLPDFPFLDFKIDRKEGNIPLNGKKLIFFLNTKRLTLNITV